MRAGETLQQISAQPGGTAQVIFHPAKGVEQCWGSVTVWRGSGSLTMDPDPNPTPDPTPFFRDFKDAKKNSFSFFITFSGMYYFQS
jgi:hypothetical protein